VTGYYLPEGLLQWTLAEPALEQPYWDAARTNRLVMQRCGSCREWQWGPEWICHRCLSREMLWEEVPPRGVIYSWERVWHPVHPLLSSSTPYIVVLVEIEGTGGTRMLGNLLGDREQSVVIGSPVRAIFEHHNEAEKPFTLVQWEATGASDGSA
jgi:uncharacterized OB-fold protein